MAYHGPNPGRTRRTFTREQLDVSRAAWDAGRFSDEWKPWRHLAAMSAGIIDPPQGHAYSAWRPDHPRARHGGPRLRLRPARRPGGTAMTDPLDTLSALEAAATKGPWHRHTYGHRDIAQIVRRVGRALRAGVWPSTDCTWVHPDANDDTDPVVCMTGNGPRQTENAAFIAAARNALPALLTIARALPEDPGFGGSWCLWCEAPFGHLPHKPDCPWLAASTEKATL